MSVDNLKDELCSKEGVGKIAEQIAKFMLKHFRNLSLQELVSEVALILLEKRKELCKKEVLELPFLAVVVRNRLYDKFFRKKEIGSINFSNLEGGDERRFEERIAVSHKITSLLTVKEAVNLLKEKLSQREIEILCYYLHSVIYRKEENPFLAGKSQDAKYKAWSRLKPKIREILKDFYFSEEEMRLFSELFLSECEGKSR